LIFSINLFAPREFRAADFEQQILNGVQDAPSSGAFSYPTSFPGRANGSAQARPDDGLRAGLESILPIAVMDFGPAPAARPEMTL
jgi:hypothetical protein